MAPCAPSGASVGVTSSTPPMETRRPLMGHPVAIALDINTRCAKISLVPSRVSVQATMAPDVPSEMTLAAVWLPGAVHSPAPSTGHRGSTTPEPNTCAANTSLPGLPLRVSVHVTMIPPALSPTIPSPNWVLGALETCLLYTSDAADERSSVDLGGRRI